MSDLEQPDTTGPDQPSSPEAAPQPVVAPAATPGDGPWASDLAKLFPDESVRSTVDQYVRTTWQPRTTQLEQQLAESRDAQRLYDDLVQNPIETYQAITGELFDAEDAQRILSVLQGEGAQPEAQPEQQAPPADPRVEQAVAYFEQQQAEQAYESEMSRVQAEHPGLQEELFHPFVAAAEGDFNEAYTMYENWVNQWNSSNEEPTEPESAPPVMGDGTTAPPVAPKAQSLGDAVDAFLAANAPGDAPPVS